MRKMTQTYFDMLEACESEEDWNKACDKIKSEGGYPSDWYATVVLSGTMARIAARWKGDDQIRIYKI